MKSYFRSSKVTISIVLLTFIIARQIGNANVNASAADVQISAGDRHSLLVWTDGTLWAWGDGDYGKLGDGKEESRSKPVQIGENKDWKQISAGEFHSLGIKSNGTLWAWGSNADGELGDASNVNQQAPVQIGSDTDWNVISAGGRYSMAIKTDRSLWGWGANYTGQLGDGTTDNRTVPTRIGEDTDWVFVETGPALHQRRNWPEKSSHTLAIKSDGSLWAWGDNVFRQLGDGTSTERHTPVRIDSYVGSVWIRASAGYEHTIALDSGGMLWAWGNYDEGQLGISGLSWWVSTPRSLPGSDWSRIDAGGYYSAAIRENGSLWLWGSNGSGQLGVSETGEPSPSETPLQEFLKNQWTSVSAGGSHTLAVRSDGTVWAWGSNVSGQLGDGTRENRNVPTMIPASTFGSVEVPTITLHPSDQTVLTEERVVFQVEVSGTPPFRYQWQFNGVDIPGAAAASYVIEMANHSDEGRYRVMVSNDGGTVPSNEVALTVRSPIASSINASELTLTATGDAEWIGQSHVVRHGTAAAQSGTIEDGQTSGISTTILGPIDLSFWWRVSSQQNADYLRFLIDDTLNRQISGENDWQEVNVSLEKGLHTLTWEYVKDTGTSDGMDAGWVDQIEYQSTLELKPEIILHPEDLMLQVDQDAIFIVKAIGVGSLMTYQWQFNGEDIPDATGPVLTIENVRDVDAGFYTATVRNLFGESTSAAAHLIVFPDPATEIFAMTETADPDTPIVAFDGTGDMLLFRKDHGQDRINNVVFTTADFEQISVWFNRKGLPTRAYLNQQVLLFANYTSTTVDLAVIGLNENGPDPQTQHFKQIELDDEAREILRQIAEAGQVVQQSIRTASLRIRDPDDFFEPIDKGIKAYDFTKNLISTARGPSENLRATGTKLVKKAITKKVKEYIIGDNEMFKGIADAVGIFISYRGCRKGSVRSCFDLGYNSAKKFVELAKITIGIMTDEIVLAKEGLVDADQPPESDDPYNDYDPTDPFDPYQPSEPSPGFGTFRDNDGKRIFYKTVGETRDASGLPKSENPDAVIKYGNTCEGRLPFQWELEMLRENRVISETTKIWYFIGNYPWKLRKMGGSSEPAYILLLYCPPEDVEINHNVIDGRGPAPFNPVIDIKSSYDPDSALCSVHPGVVAVLISHDTQVLQPGSGSSDELNRRLIFYEPGSYTVLINYEYPRCGSGDSSFTETLEFEVHYPNLYGRKRRSEDFIFAGTPEAVEARSTHWILPAGEQTTQLLIPQNGRIEFLGGTVQIVDELGNDAGWGLNIDRGSYLVRDARPAPDNRLKRVFAVYQPHPVSEDQEPNDDMESALDLPVGQVVEGHVGGVTLMSNGQFARDSDDWWKLVIPNAGYLTLQGPGRDIESNFRGYDSDRVVNYPIGAGTYYIDVGRFGEFTGTTETGGHRAYKLKADFESHPDLAFNSAGFDEIEPNNIRGESDNAEAKESGNVLPLNGEPTSGFFGVLNPWGRDQSDVWKFTIDQPGYVSFSLTTDDAVYLDWVSVGRSTEDPTNQLFGYLPGSINKFSSGFLPQAGDWYLHLAKFGVDEGYPYPFSAGAYSIAAKFEHDLFVASGPNGNPAAVESGGEVQLHAEAIDPRGEDLTYLWTAGCSDLSNAGAFNDPSLQKPIWTAPVNLTESAWECEITVTASSPQGDRQATGSYTQSVLNGIEATPPMITRGPTDQTVPPGTGATFSVIVTGSEPFSYQWHKDGIDIEGATQSVYGIADVQQADAGAYSVEVQNAAGSVLSQPAYLAVQEPEQFILTLDAVHGVIQTDPALPSYPPSTTVEVLAIPAAGYDFVNWTGDAKGVQNPVLIVMDRSKSVSVVFKPLPRVPEILTQPYSQTVEVGSSVTFSVEAASTEPLSYQWQKDEQSISGATQNIYSVSQARPADAGKYSAIVSNGGGSVISDEVVLTVNVPLSKIFVTPSPVHFGDVFVGETASKQLTLLNAGSADLYITAITSDLDDALNTTETALTIPQSASHDINLTLAPSTSGEIDGKLMISGNTPDSPITIPIQARAIAKQPPIEQPIEPPKITARITGSSIVLEWSGGHTLQVADDITGPWTDLVGASSPTIVNNPETRRFYRLWP